MNRTSKTNLTTKLALLAGLAISGTALAQPVTGLLWQGPTLVDGITEVIGPRSVVTLRVPAGSANAGAQLVGAANFLNVSFLALDSGGNVVGTTTITDSAVCPQLGTAFNNGANNDLVLTFTATPAAQSQMRTFLASAIRNNAVGIQASVVTAGGDSVGNGFRTAFNATNETTDRCARPDLAGPSIASAYMNVAGDHVYLVFDEQVAVTGPDGGDIQVRGAAQTNVFDNATPAGTNVTSVTAFGADTQNRTLDVLLAGGTNIVRNGFVRIVADDNGVPNATTNANNIRDVAGNLALQKDGGGFNTTTGAPTGTTAGVQIGDIPALQITAVKFITTVDDTGATYPSALEFTYNLPINNPGDDAFYSGGGTKLRRVDSGGTEGASQYTLAFNNNSGSKVLVDMTGVAGGTDESIFADGKGATGETYKYNISASGTLPTSIFPGAAAFAQSATVNVTDGIVPTIAGRAYLDQNGDGKQDAVAWVFSETVTHNTTASDFAVAKVAGAVNPFGLIDQDGALVAHPTGVVLNGTPANNNLAITGLTLGNVAGNTALPTTVQSRLFVNNALISAFDPNVMNWDEAAGTPVGSDTEAIPGTGDTGRTSLAFSGVGRTVTDANGNVLNLPTLAATATNLDRAAPVAKYVAQRTGDAGSDEFKETDGTVGDAASNNTLTIYTSESLASTANNADRRANLFYAPGVNFGNLANGVVAGNATTFAATGGTSPALLPTAQSSTLQVTANPGNNIKDAGGNELRLATGQNILDFNAPYIPLVTDVNNTSIHAATLIDDDAVGTAGAGFADRIEIRFTKDVLPASVVAADFTLSTGTTVTGATVPAGKPRIVELAFADGLIPMTSNVTVTYRAGATRLSTTGTPARRVNTGAAQTVVARSIAQPTTDTDDVALYTINGTITSDGTAAPDRGAKVYGFVTAPVVTGVTFNYNGTDYTMNVNDLMNSANNNVSGASLNAFTNWLLGVEPHLYLHSTGNGLEFTNNGFGSSLLCEVKVTANNLGAVTFTGSKNPGGSDRFSLTNGKATVSWDVLRSSGGTTHEFNRTGYQIFGTPIASRAVVDNTTGAYNLIVGAPIEAFGSNSRLNSVERPVIIVVETADGRRYAASSLLSSVNGGPVLFRANNRTQQTGTNAGQAFGPATFNVNLGRIGSKAALTGWSLQGLDRAGGWAKGAGTLPTLPNGVTAADVTGSGTPAANTFITLPNTDARDSLVYWNDQGNAASDGIWDLNDDGGDFSSIIVDAGFLNGYWFTLTNRGVQLNDKIDSLVGGYGFGYFNALNVATGYFYFGAPITQNAVFATTGTGVYPNNSTNAGWALAVPTIAGPNNTVANFFTNNGTKFDGALWLNRTLSGWKAYSLGAGTPPSNPQNITSIPAGSAWFMHFRP